MKITLQKITGITAAATLGLTTLMLAPAASAADPSAQIRQALAPSIEAAANGIATLSSERAYQFEGYSRSGPAIKTVDFWLAANKSGKLEDSSVPYSYQSSTVQTLTKKTPATQVRQGIAESASDGGTWIQRSQLQGILPRNVSRANPGTIITGLQTNARLARQVATVDGMTPKELAVNLISLPAKYEPRAETFSITEAEGRFGRTRFSWRTGNYTNERGETCTNTWVKMFVQQGGSRDGLLTSYEIDEFCGPPGELTETARYTEFDVVAWQPPFVPGAPEPSIRYRD
jgi:hypothetical protein